jgi:hypothetical protein
MASSPQRCGNLHRFSDEHRAAGSAVHQGRGALVAIDLPTTFFFCSGADREYGPRIRTMVNPMRQRGLILRAASADGLLPHWPWIRSAFAPCISLAPNADR